MADAKNDSTRNRRHHRRRLWTASQIFEAAGFRKTMIEMTLEVE
jgi:hypothetical protein